MSTALLPQTAPAYHWTGLNQRRFLETLAQTGVVGLAAKAVAMSSQAAYDFRMRAAGRVFALGWLAAILLSRDRLVDDLMERAFLGQEEEMVRDPDNHRLVRKRIDNRLGMGMLSRLDRMVEAAAGVAAGVAAGQGDAFTQSARLVAGDFERFLDLVEREGSGAEAGLFLATHADTQACAFHYQLAENSAELEGDDETNSDAMPADVPSPEGEAAALSVWWDGDTSEWRTDFPPPPDFDGDEVQRYGEDEYQRSLSAAERAVQDARLAVEERPFRRAADQARDAWFTAEPLVRAELRRREAEAMASARKRLADAKAVARAEAKRRAADEKLARKERERQAEAAPAPMDEPCDGNEGAALIEAPWGGENKAVMMPASGVASFRPITMTQKPRPLFGIYGDKPPSQSSVW